jgi:MFS family permease
MVVEERTGPRPVEEAPEAPGREKRGFAKAFSSLRSRDYRWYFVSGLGMTAAQGIQQLALAILILDLTGSVGQLGLMIFIRGVPMAVIALFGGVLADRYNRRNLLIYNQAFSFANMLLLGIFCLTGVVEVWHVYVTSVVLGVTQSLTMPARQALIRSLVRPDELMNAIALNSFQQNSARIIWPTMAGGLITFLGTGAALLACAGGLLVGIVFLLPLGGVVQEYSDRRRSPMSELVEGLRYTTSTPLIATVMTLGLSIGMFGLAYMSMGPGFAHQVLHLNAAQTGLFMMASGIGSIVGSILWVIWEPKDWTPVFVAVCACFGGSLLALALSPWVVSAFLFMAWFGFSTASLVVSSQAIFQTEVPHQLLGRVFSVWTMSGGLGSVTALPIGVAGDAFGLRWSLGAVAVAMLAVTIFVAAFRLPRLRSMKDVAAVPSVVS